MIGDKLHGFKCIRAHVYKDKGELFIDYWGVDKYNPQIKIHVPRMSLDIDSISVMQRNTPFNGTCNVEKTCAIANNKNDLFEFIIDDRKKKKGGAK